MSLVAGDRLGPYEVVALLGTGGMGEVYRARDSRLNRDVAVKVLAQAGSDPARQRRLLDEAQAASALNHPNIVTVYDVGTHDGTPFVVSEIVEGESLRASLGRAPLPLRDVLDLGAQMADGLAAAHQAGIVHRDFKPENVMLTRDGRVKILDFGLAVIGAREGLSAASVDVTLTVAGMIVGTVPYMSPEQARGSAVDYRTDQFSLGLTLYEMVTGRRAFIAETAAQVLAAILDDEPEPIARVNPKVPAPVRWAIERCLAKDARQRYHATGDLAADLRTLRDRLVEFASPTDLAPAPPRRGMWAVAAVAIMAIGVIAGLVSGDVDTGLERYRFTPFATDAGYQASPSWSPDGKTLAYVADVNGVLQVFTRALASSRDQVTHSRFDCQDPFWSPDGTRLFYISQARDRGGLWSISVAGGEPEIVLEDVSRAALSPDGKTLAFFRDESEGALKLWLSSPPGSSPVRYTRPPFGERGYAEATLHFAPDGSKLGVWFEGGKTPLGTEFWVLPLGNGTPRAAPSPVADLAGIAPPFSWLPDSRHVLSGLPRPRPGTHLWLMDTDRSAPRMLMATGGIENDPAVSPDGTRVALAFQQADYDLYQMTVGDPSPSVVLATSRNEMDPAWSLSSNAMMAFTTDRAGHDEIWLRGPKGEYERPLVTPSDFGASRTDLLSAPAFSPDGQRVAYSRAAAEGYQIWITSVAGGQPVQLTPDLASGSFGVQDWPSWSPDGVWVAYAQSVADKTWRLARMRVGARTQPEVVTPDLLPFSRVQWSPDNAWIAYNGRSGLSIVSPDGQSTRVLQEQTWMAFTWSEDSKQLYGIRQSDDFRHLTFTSVEIRSGAEHVISPDFKPAPVAGQPVRGLTRVSKTTFLASIAKVSSDIWLLDGFQPTTLWERLVSAMPFERR